MAATLNITDGTTTINLIKSEDSDGFHLANWTPRIPGYKGGGTFQSSPLADGRRLVNSQFDSYVEVFNLLAKGSDQDELIREIQDMRRLLEKAASYWTASWTSEPVWLEAQASQETNKRYAVIMMGQIQQDGNPYAQPFLQPECEAIQSVTLAVEHLFWTEELYSTVTAIEIGQRQEYDSQYYGNVDGSGDLDPTTANEVFAANKHVEDNITHVYRDDGGVFSANLRNSTNFNLLPAVPAVGDNLYIGCDSVFTSVVFDISTGGAGYTGQWEFWDTTAGPGWATFLMSEDLTSGLTATGVNTFTFEPELAWATTVVNGVNAWWIRFTVTAIPGALTAPVQASPPLYSVVWSYIEIQSLQVPGDIPPLLKMRIENASAFDSGVSTRVILGTRSYERGANFRPYINISDIQIPSGLIISAAGVYSTDEIAPTGRAYAFLNAAATWTVHIEFFFDETLSEQYAGEFHAFLRAAKTSGTLKARLRYGTEFEYAYSDEGVFTSAATTSDVYMVDLGKIHILPYAQYGIAAAEYYLAVELYGDGAVDGTLYDVVLMPVDEFAIDTYSPDELRVLSADTDQVLHLDGITNPKSINGTSLLLDSSGNVIIRFVIVSNGLPRMQANKQQRIFFLHAYEDNNGYWESEPFNLNRYLFYRQSQYLSMRGDR